MPTPILGIGILLFTKGPPSILLQPLFRSSWGRSTATGCLSRCRLSIPRFTACFFLGFLVSVWFLARMNSFAVLPASDASSLKDGSDDSDSDYVEKDPAGRYVRGVKPASLSKVSDPQIREFIQKCLVPASDRLSAKELLTDAFLQTENPKELIRDPLSLPNLSPRSLNLSGPLSMDVDTDYKLLSLSTCSRSNKENLHCPVLEFQRTNNNNEFRLKGMKNEDNTVSLTLRIADSAGRVRNIHFLFYLESDTALSVAAEMVEHLELADHDVTFIAEFIDFLIIRLLPGWKPSSNYMSHGVGVPGISSVHGKDKVSEDAGLPDVRLQGIQGDSYDSIGRTIYDNGFYSSQHLANLGDQDSGASVASEILEHKHDEAAEFVDCTMDGLCNDSSGYASEDFGDSHYEDCRPSENDIRAGDCFQMNNFLRNSTSSFADLSGISNVMSLTSSCSSLSFAEKDMDLELKLELDAIEAQYQHWFLELSRMREEALEATKKRWVTKRKLTIH